MFTRIRIALGLVLLLSLLTSVTVFAKGGFDFITITGPNLEEAVHVSDIALTESFFAFANFYEERTKAPADPGEGFEIIRYYEQGVSARAFDRLHYYPESGFVFYDGIENGDSEYDGGWYTANPKIRPLFEAALAVPVSVAPVEKKQPVASVSGSQAESAGVPSTPAGMGIQVLPLVLIVLAGGLTALAALTALAIRRKPSTQ